MNVWNTAPIDQSVVKKGKMVVAVGTIKALAGFYVWHGHHIAFFFLPMLPISLQDTFLKELSYDNIGFRISKKQSFVFFFLLTY